MAAYVDWRRAEAPAPQDVCYFAVRYHYGGGDRDQRKCVRGTVPQLQISRMLSETIRRQVDTRDDLAWRKVRVDMRRVPGKSMELVKRDRTFAGLSLHANNGVQRRKRDAHI